jgi:hypothetical protein
MNELYLWPFQDRLNDIVTRILATWYKFNMDSPNYPAKWTGMPIDILKTPQARGYPR